MLSICFMANFKKTEFFLAISEHLKTRFGYKIYFICVDERHFDLLKKDERVDGVIKLGMLSEVPTPPSRVDRQVNDLIYGDRALKHDPLRGRAFLRAAFHHTKDFLKANDVDYVLGELTWAHELLVHRICNSWRLVKSVYLMPHTVRIPNERFGLFSDEYQSRLLPIEQTRPSALFRIERPSYFSKNNDLMRFDLKRHFVKRVLLVLDPRNFSRSDPTRLALRRVVVKRVGTFLRSLSYKFFTKKSSFEGMDTENYIFYAFHKQPEASVDVIGRYYEDQFQNVVNLWRALPDGWFLLIKDHSNAIGDRGMLFYRKLLKFPGIVLLKETEDSRVIISNARAVVTVSGTVAYEAALSGIPAFTFGPVFFQDPALCLRLSIDDLKDGSFLEKIEQLEQSSSEQARTALKARVLQNSLEGIISDPLSDPSCMSDDNIQRVSRGLIQALEHR